MASIIPLLTEFEKEHISERQALPEKYLGLSDAEMDARIADARRALGDRLVILGHHYQRDEVIRFADYTGDSFRLARQIANRPEADYIVFCGVHFMAESADVLCAPHQKVILPDLAAGCSMADMAAPEQLETCWEELTQMGIATQGASGQGVVPVTYINSAASIKAFVGERGGTVCTSSNAMATLKWAFARGERDSVSARPAPRAKHRLQDGHSARRDGGLGSGRDLRRSRSRSGEPGEDDPVEGALLRPYAVQREADRSDSSAASRRARHRPSRSAVGRRAGCGRQRQHRIHHQDGHQQPGRIRSGRSAPKFISSIVWHSSSHPGGQSLSLDQFGCLCSTMFRVSPNHLLWILEELLDGRVHNRVTVPDDQKHWNRVALDRMLSIS